jgi:NAD-dependent dihydropyrimidine dehydrogenase PreA subunit
MPVQLNLTACTKCRNAFVIDTLKERVAAIKEDTGIDVSERVILTEAGAALRFEELSYDRRGFFSALKKMTLREASGLLEKKADNVSKAYSEKRLPLKRDLLLRVLRRLDDKKVFSRIVQQYAFTVSTEASCDGCFSCIGMCPTGALKATRDEPGAGLLFNPSLCNGCGLCRDFCINNALTLSQGYRGEDFFGHGICARTTETAHSGGDDAHPSELHAGWYNVPNGQDS